MAEIKNTFQAGKMNKSVDERLIPKGEYRDALNIEVRTTEDSDAGSVQNLYSNILRDTYSSTYPINPTVNRNSDKSYFVGAKADERNNCAYFFVASPVDVSASFSNPNVLINSNILYKDMIIKYDNNTRNIKPVFNDIWKSEFTATELNTSSQGDTSAGVDKFQITYTTTVTKDIVKSAIRPGMIVKGFSSGGHGVPGVSYNLDYDGLNPGQLTVREVEFGSTVATVYFDVVVKGDFTSVASWSFTAKKVLNFSGKDSIGNRDKKHVVGINIIDDLLFFTDGNTEPKKINTRRAIKGSADSFDKHTDVYVTDGNTINSLVRIDDGDEYSSSSQYKEEHITVVRRAPRTAPKIKMSKFENAIDFDFVQSTSGVVTETPDLITINEDETTSLLTAGDEITVSIDLGVDNASFSVGKIIILECSQDSESSVSVRCLVISVNQADSSIHTLEIQSIDQNINDSHLNWTASLEQSDPIFQLKFGRFSYRYKYEDGEYSTFAPFSELVFLPSALDYTPKKGYNLGMVNDIRTLKVIDFVVNDAQRPDDVVAVDLLYKDTVSPNVYVVKTINKDKDSEWSDESELTGNSGVFNVTSEMIHRTLESSQTLRAWDNVPRFARAQEVTGNRIVYANYLQNFDLLCNVHVKQNFSSLLHRSNQSEDPTFFPEKSVKSIRNYKVGVVLGDKYGRETPVISQSINNTTVNIGKVNAPKVNSINASLTTSNDEPGLSNMDYYKFYIKETSNEYYNLVMDHWYNAEDGNVWLSFQSADRNKVDLETYLILKNGHGNNEAVLDNARYKILAISNEAPDFIKTTNKTLVSQQTNIVDLSTIPDLEVIPFTSLQFEGAFEDIRFEGIGYGRFRAIEGSDVKFSRYVKIARINSTDNSISLVESVGESGDFATLFGITAGDIDDIVFEIKDAVVENRPEFDGKFFVKLFRDGVLSRNVLQETVASMTYQAEKVFDFAYISSTGTNDANSAANYKGNYAGVSSPDPTNAIGSSDKTNYTWTEDGNFPAANVNSRFANTGYQANTQGYWDWYSRNESGKGFKEKYFLDNSHYLDVNNTNCRNKNHGLQQNTMTFSVVGETAPNLTENQNFKNSMTTVGTLFRFPSDPFDEVYQVNSVQTWNDRRNFSTKNKCKNCSTSEYPHRCMRRSFEITFSKANDPSQGLDTNTWDPRSTVPHDGSALTHIEIVKAQYNVSESVEVNSDNAIWETEPKEDVGLDLYYEATQALPIKLRQENINSFIPLLSSVQVNRPNILLQKSQSNKNPIYLANPTESSYTGKTLVVHSTVRDIVSVKQKAAPFPFKIRVGDTMMFTHDDGMVTRSKVLSHWHPIDNYNNVDGTVATYKPSNSFTYSVSVSSSGVATISTSSVDSTNFVTTGSGQIWEVTGGTIASGVKVFANTITHSDGTTTIDLYKVNPTTADADNGSENYAQITSISQLNSSLSTSTSMSLTFSEITGYYKLDKNVYKYNVKLPWFNCYSFGNGIESDRIRDDFNAPTIDNGCKVSTTLEGYKSEVRGSGLIYSGIYNSTSGVNQLNEFNMAQAITKDLNPIYGTIQALKTRDTNLVTFCEDKVFKILANKDALFNADGNTNLTASSNVLGNAIGFVGDYGISLNPESLAFDSYRMYFTDKQRNKVLRLSQDGLTPISDINMSTYFRENLKDTNELIGSFDEIKGEYNLSLKYLPQALVDNTELSNITVSFNESSKGWASFKSFVPETGLSINDEYLTGVEATVWSHHDKTQGTFNNFYGVNYNSTVDVVFNEAPGSVKSFNTMSYEGTKAAVNIFSSNTDGYQTATDAAGNSLTSLTDGEFYNISTINGWFVESFNTDLQEGKVDEFIDKEGKWYNYIKGINTILSNVDSKEFSVQGIGFASTVVAPTQTKFTLTVSENND